MLDKNYITIQGWMRTKLGLSGNELIAYAVIYGFSQDGKTEFMGTAQYIADWCGIAKENALRLLKRLVEKDVIIKRENNIGGVKFCYYSFNPNVIGYDETSSGDMTKRHKGYDETSSDNKTIDNNNINNTSIKKDIYKSNALYISKENSSSDGDYLSDKPNKTNKAKRFQKPTIEEIKQYALERNSSVDPNYFYDYCEACDWMIGKQKMKDWKARFRMFESNSKRWDKTDKPNKTEHSKTAGDLTREELIAMGAKIF